jgi:hypothetical protein
MLTDHLKTNGKMDNNCDEKVSAAAMAATYNKANGKAHRAMIEGRLKGQSSEEFLAEEAKKNKKDRKYLENEGGRAADVLHLSLKNGYCTENDAPSDDYKYSLAGDCIAKESGTCGLKTLVNTIYKYKTTGQMQCEAIEASLRIAPNLNELDIISVLVSFEATKIIETLIESSCQLKGKPEKNWLGDLKIDTKVVDKYDRPGKVGFKFREIDEVLNSSRPVAISYFSNLLFQKPGNQLRTGNHAGIIVGREYDCKKGKNVYLLRNTWGDGCARFYETSYDYKKEELCKNGYYTKAEEKTYLREIKQTPIYIKYADSEKDKNQYRERKKKLEKKLANLRKLKLVSESEKTKIYQECKKKSKVETPINPAVSCKNGLLRIDGDALKKSMYGITYLEKK